MNRYLTFFFLLALSGVLFTGCGTLKDWGVLEDQTVAYSEVEVVNPETGEKETVQVPITATGLNPKIIEAADDLLPTPWGAIGVGALTLLSSVLTVVTRKQAKAKKAISAEKEVFEKTLKATVKNVEKLPDDAKDEFKKAQKLDTDSKGKKIIDDLVASA
jgi:hypothetical protein